MSTLDNQQDAKYLIKYKELKKKIKQIELDNDKMLIHILKSKRNIQRLRLERAILYEKAGLVLQPANNNPLQQHIPIPLPPPHHRVPLPLLSPISHSRDPRHREHLPPVQLIRDAYEADPTRAPPIRPYTEKRKRSPSLEPAA